MGDTPDRHDDETFEEWAARHGFVIDDDPTTTVLFLGPKGTAAMKKLVERIEESDD